MERKANEYDLEVRKEHRLIARSYTAFLTTIAVAISAKYSSVEYSGLIVFLLSISIPSSIASVNIENFTNYGKENNKNITCSIVYALTYIPSMVAFSVLFSNASVIAGITFATMSTGWFFHLSRLRSINT